MSIMMVQPGRFGAAFDYGPDVEAALSGSAGFALDFADTATMWEESTKTTQVSATSDPIGAIDSKWGTTAYDALVSSPQIPLWNGSNAADLDGTDDYFPVASAAALLNSKPAGFSCQRINLDSLAIRATLVALSGASSLQPRFSVRVLTTGAVELTARTINASTQTILASATGVVSTGQSYVVTAMVDYAGTRAGQVWVNGTLVINGTLTQAASNTSATDSARFWIGRNIAVLEYLNGRMGRMVFADKLMTASEIASIEAWVDEGSLV